jgi:serine/threonine-protein kinase OSR1/STK39
MLSSSSSAALRRNGSFFESTPKVQYPTSASDYAVKEEIGRGVSAKVYRAECIPLGETVAVKMLDLEDDPGHLEEIRREVASMSMVSHPNLVTAHCSFVEGQFLWVVMPFLSGGSALNIMKWSHPKGLDEASIATILKEVLKALDYFHRNGNIHRDVKAGNVLVDRDGSVKLADFGVSAASWGSGAKPHSTFVGTPCWMAPEVMEQVDGYDYHADIWSLGITVLELCHGHAPFAKYPPMKVLLMTLQNPPPQLEAEQAETGHHFTRGLRDFVSVCLQKDPKRRPSAAKLLEHRFLKEAKKPDFLVKHLLEPIPALGERAARLNARELARQAERAAAVAAGNLGGAASTDAAAEKKSQAEYVKGVSMWNFNMDEIRAEAARMDDGAPAGASLKHPTPTLPAVPEVGAGTGSRPLSPTHSGPNSGHSSPRALEREKSVEQRGRFTVFENENGAERPEEEGKQGLARTASTVQKGRFIVTDDGEPPASSEALPDGKKPEKKKGSASSMIIGASDPEPGAVAAAAKAAAAAERDLDPPRLKMRGLFEAAQAAAELATRLKERHEDMEEEEKKITQLVEDNRWLRRRVAELEHRVGELEQHSSGQ